MHHRDKLRRRLLPVKIVGAPGDEAELRTGEGKAAGELRSQVGDVGMAWLRLEPDDGVLSVASADGEVICPQWMLGQTAAIDRSHSALSAPACSTTSDTRREL